MTANMSQGITPFDFVQQVYYMQEKVLLDWWPIDDKYREVLVEANFVLKELEAVEDWTWLRETVILGSCDNITNEIIEFTLPEDMYKISTLNHDTVRLYPFFEQDPQNDGEYIINEQRYIPVPIASAGDQRWNREKQTNGIGVNQIHDYQLRAVVHGNILKFNRPLLPHEASCIVVVDIQKHIKPFHVCNPRICQVDQLNPEICPNAENVYLTEIPDPNYVVMATAARHAEGSPPALARVAGLQDAAQRILSQMRQNDASATDSDYIEWDVPGYIEVI